MEFERVKALTKATPTAHLCAVWGIPAEDVDARKRAETPLSIREAGSLAGLHGLKLEDVLSV